MSNLITIEVNTRGLYKTLAELTGLTFTADTEYVLQGAGAEFFLREGTEGNGFKIANKEKVQWKQGNDNIYIKTMAYDKISINIAE